jgi:hypothetical protein
LEDVKKPASILHEDWLVQSELMSEGFNRLLPSLEAQQRLRDVTGDEINRKKDDEGDPYENGDGLK